MTMGCQCDLRHRAWNQVTGICETCRCQYHNRAEPFFKQKQQDPITVRILEQIKKEGRWVPTKVAIPPEEPMTMKHVYIAAPFSGPNRWHVEKNIRVAEEVALEVAHLGGVPVCPHTMYRFFEGTLPYERWLEITMALQTRCDATLMGPNWDQSPGAVKEFDAAVAMLMPVFRMHELPALQDWLADPNAQPVRRNLPEPGSDHEQSEVARLLNLMEEATDNVEARSLVQFIADKGEQDDANWLGAWCDLVKQELQ